jgi:hypothetical protein
MPPRAGSESGRVVMVLSGACCDRPPKANGTDIGRLRSVGAIIGSPRTVKSAGWQPALRDGLSRLRGGLQDGWSQLQAQADGMAFVRDGGYSQ